MNKDIPKYKVVWDLPRWAPMNYVPHQGRFITIRMHKDFLNIKDAHEFMKLRPSARLQKIKIVDENRNLA